MIEFIAVNMAPIMFCSLIIFLLLGYPVAFSLAANGLLFFFIGVELAPLSQGAINLSWPLLYALPDRFYGGVMANETLLAIPFFTFMGIVLERSGMAEDLLDTIGQLSVRSAAVSPMRSSSSARCWPLPPAWWPPRSSRWG
jgi:TRAP-type mannitol/chloroaromatic compound transport system permease large subunit